MDIKIYATVCIFKPNLPLSKILSSQLTALSLAQLPGYYSMGYTDLYGGWHQAGLNPGPYGLVV